MGQVVVDSRGVQLLQLGVQEPIHVRALSDEDSRQFGGQLDAFPVPVRQSSGQESFAFSAMIHPRRIQVVHTAIDGMPHLARRLFGIDPAFFLRQAHTPEPQNRKLVSVARHFSVEHNFSNTYHRIVAGLRPWRTHSCVPYN